MLIGSNMMLNEMILIALYDVWDNLNISGKIENNINFDNYMTIDQHIVTLYKLF